MNYFKIFITLFCLAIIAGCSVFFEKDIENKDMKLLSPADSLRTKISTLTFWWESLDGASNYELQVVSPNFKAIEKLLLDTVLTDNKFLYSLSPGKYQWRVRAYNGGYTTDYFYRTVQIDSTLDLTSQEVILLEPAENYYTKKSSVVLKWSKLYNATEYMIDVKSPDWNGSRIASTRITTYDTTKVELTEGKFAWGIRASNNESVSGYSHRNILVDQTAPSKPTLALPASSATVTSWPVSLSWTRVTDSGSPLYDSLLVASDSVFTESSIKLAIPVDDQSYSLDLKNKGYYYWKVKTCDKAGNSGPFTSFRKFIMSN
jgi:hypothetical protein